MSRDIQAELKRLHEVNPNVGVVYNGRTALEWYELYCQASGELEAVKKLERDRWTGWAKSFGLHPVPGVNQTMQASAATTERKPDAD